MLKYVGVKCLDTLQLPCQIKKGDGVWKNGPSSDAKKVSVFITDENVIVTYTGGLVIQKLVKIPALLEMAAAESNIKTIADHNSLITCIGFSQHNSLLCTCSDEKVILRKWDSNQWDSYTIGEEMGKILSCSIAIHDIVIFIFLAKQDEIMVLQAVSSYSLLEAGPLDVCKLDMFLTMKKVRENVIWLKCVILNDIIYLIGLTSGNGVTLQMWELGTQERKLKMVSHMTAASNMKNFVAVDLEQYEGEYYLLLSDQSGYVEIYCVSPNGFALINRIKLEETMTERTPSETCLTSANNSTNLNSTINSAQVEFRVSSARFFFKEFQQKKKVDENGSDEDMGLHDNISPLNNSLAAPSPHTSTKYPKLSFLIATANKLLIVDGKSGENQILVNYEEIIKSNSVLVNNAKLAVNMEYGEVLIAIQPILQKHIFTYRLYLDAPDRSEDCEECDICTIIPQEAVDTGSVLRKKLKSPTRKPERPKKLFLSKLNKSLYPTWMDAHQEIVTRCSKAKGSSSTGHFDVPLSSRAIKISPKSSYNSKNLHFSDNLFTKLPGNLSEGLSSLRMAMTKDGKAIAIGGNKSPVIVAKTYPIFDNVHSFKDVSHLTSISFSFNSKYLLLASNDCKTVVMDWLAGKEKMNFRFTSKFNEHIHSQFYFMDKFILQPEGKHISLYSYSFRESGNIKLKAGSFEFNCQTLTALAAVNQFLSNVIIVGESNKCMEVFDANVEQVILRIPNCHTKPINCIRLNEAPKGPDAIELCNFVLTTCPSYLDPIKIWDLRTAKCSIRLSDMSGKGLMPTSRPSLSPCGRYIASGYEDNMITIYDVRKVNSRVHCLQTTHSTVLDCLFDPNFPAIWCGCKNGTFWHLNVYD